MNYTNIQNGIQINGTGSITGITNSGTLSNNSYTLPTESVVKSYYDSNFMFVNSAYTQSQMTTNFLSGNTPYYTQSQYYTNLLSNSGMSFTSLSQTATYWMGMTTTSNGNIYASVYNNAVGDIYMKTGGTGNFFSLGMGNSTWIKMATDSNNNVYCAVYAGGIWKQTGGTGKFFAMPGITTRNWRGLCADKKGNLYATVSAAPGQGIYKYTGGTSDFFSVYLTANNWFDLACASNGDIYACMYGGDIYKSTGGTDNFYALGQTSRNWYGMTADLSGNVYACVYDASVGDIYKQYGGTGNFIAQNNIQPYWVGMTVAPNGDVYATQYFATGNIWKNTYTPISFSYTQTQYNTNFLSANTVVFANTTAYGSLNFTSNGVTSISITIPLSAYVVITSGSLTGGSCLNISATGSTGRLTIQSAGTYLMTYMVSGYLSNTTRTDLYLFQNGGTVLSKCRGSVMTSNYINLSGNAVFSLAVNDYLDLELQNGNETITILGYNLCAVRIS